MTMALHPHDSVVDPYWLAIYLATALATANKSLALLVVNESGDKGAILNVEEIALFRMSHTRCDDL